MASSAEIWFLNIDELAKKYHVYALDKLGQGYTDNPKVNEDYTMGAQVKHAVGFMNKLNISNAHLLGHSRGGYMTTRIALEYPHLAKSIVIIDSATLMANPNTFNFYEDVAERAKLIKDPKERTFYSAAQNSFGTEHITDEWIEGIMEYSKQPKNQEAVSKFAELRQMFVNDLANRRKETHAWIRAGRLQTPTLVIWGLNDPSAIWDPIGIDCLNLILPNVENSSMHIFNRSGHSSFREHPEEFNMIIESFINTKTK
jgi:2-hydroxy-6-oxo-6-(2'-carboxyphenyl)-hexa-2,4-dienoate hydrolase